MELLKCRRDSEHESKHPLMQHWPTKLGEHFQPHRQQSTVLPKVTNAVSRVAKISTTVSCASRQEGCSRAAETEPHRHTSSSIIGSASIQQALAERVTTALPKVQYLLSTIG
jgi:hypothetical protein